MLGLELVLQIGIGLFARLFVISDVSLVDGN